MHDIVMKLKMPNLPKPRPSDLAMVGVAFLMFVGLFIASIYASTGLWADLQTAL